MKELKLTNGKVTFIDDSIYDMVKHYTWYEKKVAGHTSYVIRTEPKTGQKYKNGKTKRSLIFLHRQITSCPLDLEVDHIDGNGLNNLYSNLRIVTSRENRLNSKVKSNSATKLKGVRKNKSGYYARIFVNGKELSLGGYPTAERAARAYDKAATLHFGKYARLNYPNG